MSIIFQLITPEKKHYENTVDMVVLPGEEGDFGVMKDHSPVVTLLRPGLIEVYNINNEITDSFFVDAGFVKVTKKDCIVLAENITQLKDVNIKECENELLKIKSKDDKEEGVSLHDTKKIKVLEAMIDLSS